MASPDSHRHYRYEADMLVDNVSWNKNLQAVLRDLLLSDNLQCPLNLSDPNVSLGRSIQVGDALLQAYCRIQYIVKFIKVAMSR